MGRVEQLLSRAQKSGRMHPLTAITIYGSLTNHGRDKAPAIPDITIEQRAFPIVGVGPVPFAVLPSMPPGERFDPGRPPEGSRI